jgi:hypothetical protein
MGVDVDEAWRNQFVPGIYFLACPVSAQIADGGEPAIQDRNIGLAQWQPTAIRNLTPTDD